MNKALLFLIGLLMIFGMMMCFENVELKTEIVSINKTLAHRERIASVWADRYNFLRYAISMTNMRVTVLEHQWKDYESTFIDAKEYFNMIDKLQSIKPGEG